MYGHLKCSIKWCKMLAGVNWYKHVPELKQFQWLLVCCWAQFKMPICKSFHPMQLIKAKSGQDCQYRVSNFLEILGGIGKRVRRLGVEKRRDLSRV